MAYDLVAGDGTKITLTFVDRVTQQPIDLTGKTAKLRYKINGGALQSRTMTPLNQTTNKGQAEYVLQAADLTASGQMVGEGRVNDGEADQLTSIETFTREVRGALS